MKSNNPGDPAGDLDPARVDLNKLRTFAVIADSGGVSAAAGRLALSRSAVSHSLASLESSLGVPLFHRVGRGLLPTREAAVLLRAWRDAEGSLAQALAALREQAEEVRGQVRLGLYPGFSRFRLAGVLDAFLAEHPAARCRLVHGSRGDLLARLRGGRLDFVLSLGPGEERERRGLASQRVFLQSLALAVRQDAPRGGPGFDAIARLPIIDYFRSEPLIDRWVAHHYGRRRISHRQVRAWVGGGTDVALELTRRGVGACVLPADLVTPYRRAGELRVIRGPRSLLRDEIWLHELPASRSSPLLSTFRAALL